MGQHDSTYSCRQTEKWITEQPIIDRRASAALKHSFHLLAGLLHLSWQDFKFCSARWTPEVAVFTTSRAD